VPVASESREKNPATRLDSRAQAVIDQSREAVEASKQAVEKSRDLLRRLDGDTKPEPHPPEPPAKPG
jgi:hypothetical protein